MGINATVSLGFQGLRHILVAGDSISYGFGSSTPKQDNSWVGVLRSALNGKYGSAGSGIVLANNDLPPSNLSWDGRMVNVGTMNEQTLGWYRTGDWQFDAGSGNYFQVTDIGTEAIITTFAKGSGIGQLSVDGGATQSFRLMATGGTTPNIDKEPGYHSGHIVIRVPLGTLGSHQVRLWGSGITFDAVTWEFRRGLSTGYIVSNASISGKAMGTLITSDETNGTYGLPLLDTAMRQGVQGMVILALETNEWTGTATTAQVKSRLATGIARVKAGGYRPVVMVPPQPNPTLQGGSMTYTQMVTAVTEQCATDAVDLINLQKLWATNPAETNETTMFNNGNAAGMFFDQIHPSDAGAISMAIAIMNFLGL